MKINSMEQGLVFAKISAAALTKFVCALVLHLFLQLMGHGIEMSANT